VSLFADALIVIACLVLNFAFAGSETALYTVSRARIEIEARQGRRAARLVQRLLADDVGLLIVLLVGNTLAIELLTFHFEDLLHGLGVHAVAKQLLLAVVLTPVVFFFGEALPKDLFRRRPHALLSVTAPLITVARVVFWPLSRSLALMTSLVTRGLGLEPRLLSVVRGREMLLRFLRESAETGAIQPQSETLARNVLKLRSIPIERAMVPWKSVVTVSTAGAEAEVRSSVAASPYTRLPVVGGTGTIVGYLHQLDVLRSGDAPVLEHLRPVLALAPDIPVDRALARLRIAGQRLAIVGTPERPVGLLTLKDLVEEISGDLAGW
jgi:CBS domain containing-hemolysin-like protein